MKFFSELNFVYTFLLLRDHGIIITGVHNFNLFFYRNEYCEILEFLRNITVKTSAAKATFFTTLHERLHEVPSQLIANRLLHLLLSRFVLIDPVAVDIFLPHILTPQSGEEYVNKMPLPPPPPPSNRTGI